MERSNTSSPSPRTLAGHASPAVIDRALGRPACNRSSESASIRERHVDQLLGPASAEFDLNSREGLAVSKIHRPRVPRTGKAAPLDRMGVARGKSARCHVNWSPRVTDSSQCAR